ncbi:DUF2239 family protein [Myxococcota bacterium]|nr:DUF2239 family protein [Myxococcota bacterium]
MEVETTYTAFVGPKCVASGSLRDVLPVLKARFDADATELVSVFHDDTGREVDFDLRGSLDEVLTRALGPVERGPGRPKLGVASREVSLLPRHWEWLEAQPNGISAALRRLVDEARKAEPGRERARRIRAALGAFMTSVAGDRPGYEEATRALFAGETARLEELVKRWPKDVRAYVLRRAELADEAQSSG